MSRALLLVLIGGSAIFATAAFAPSNEKTLKWLPLSTDSVVPTAVANPDSARPSRKTKARRIRPAKRKLEEIEGKRQDLERLRYLQTLEPGTSASYEEDVCSEVDALAEWKDLENWVGRYEAAGDLGLKPQELRNSVDAQILRVARVSWHTASSLNGERFYDCESTDVSLLNLLKASFKAMEAERLPFDSLQPFLTKEEAYQLFFRLRVQENPQLRITAA